MNYQDLVNKAAEMGVKAAKSECKKRANDLTDEGMFVFNILLTYLELAMPSAEFIAFCGELEAMEV